jgi:hypothetical protein
MEPVKSEKLESEKAESETPRADAVWEAAQRPPLDGPEKWMDATARILERENNELRGLLGELCVAVCRRMSADDPFPSTVRPLFDAYKAADAYLSQPNSLQPSA